MKSYNIQNYIRYKKDLEQTIKRIDKEYPYLIIAILVGVGSIHIAALVLGYIQRPRIIGFAMLGEGLYLYYKRYVKKT